MADQFLRAYRVVVGTTEIDASAGVGSTSLRIAFTVERDDKRTPNCVELRLWNLSAGSRKAIESAAEDSVSVSLEAGYVNDIGSIFLGDLRSARTVREGPDLVTIVAGGDGENAIRTARINRTFKAGTPVKEVLRALVQQLNIGSGNLDSAGTMTLADGSTTLRRSQTMAGLIYDELEDLCRSCGRRWSIQDSAFQIRTGDEPIAEQQGPLFDAAHGLIGTPQVETARQRKAAQKTGTLVTFTALLRPDLIPGVACRLDSEAYAGNLVAVATRHNGDSHGPGPEDWIVGCTGRPYGT